ncbi:NUDIX domain-containing protein [Streptomyces sp. NBC_01498]|uniref:NUDIX hydrolase n=1 Tax=Streptomyces sp. NBC_01498 TaxID=2975870 RepID=UPI002E7AFD47|nr:NUDIX domain-containing protein [Streptomyces sp. NBC_01498]WTL24832.1 NUDIX domain-containing protein [Streptomyces sp. NBC_01498]
MSDGGIADGAATTVLIDTVAWVRVERGRILCARSRGKDVFYIPGGKREGAETDLETLLREVGEEIDVAVLPATAVHLGTYEAQAHDRPEGDLVRMSCYSGDYTGTPAASNEIEEIRWLGYADRDRVAPVDQLLFDDLRASGELA